MFNLAKKSLRTLRTEGVIPLIKKQVIFVKCKYRVYRSQMGEGYDIQFDDVSVSVRVPNLQTALVVEYSFSEESDLISDILDELRPDDVVWDVGAHVGVHSCLLGKKADEVIAIEPYPPNIEVLERNLDINPGIDGEIFPIALSDSDGTDRLSIPEADTVGEQNPALLPNSTSESRDHNPYDSRVTEISVQKGDTLISEGVAPPDVVKIDVEGSSHKVIDGMSTLLDSGDCRAVYVEVHLPNADSTRPSVEDFDVHSRNIREQLEAFGFDVETISEKSSEFFIKGTK